MQTLTAEITKNVQIAPNVFNITFAVPQMPNITAGQFCLVAAPRADLPLKRPFAICGATKNTFEICFEVKGAGTAAIAALPAGAAADVILPLGNGFTAAPNSRILLVGGGMGAAPLLSALRLISNVEFYAALGCRNAAHALFIDEFTQKCRQTRLFSDDGTIGTRGFVTDNVREYAEKIRANAVFACGPAPMYKALAAQMQGSGTPVFVSLEERMGCGIGACLVCVCKTKPQNAAAPHHKRVCADGPVFNLSEVILP